MSANALIRSHFQVLRSSALELVLAAVLFLGTATIGLVYGIELMPASTVQPAASEPPWETLLWILRHNIPAALMLFSGVATLGISTLAGGAGVGLFLGHSMALSVSTFGPAYVIAHTVLYTPFELYGFILAFAAGLTPIPALLSLRGGFDRSTIGRTMRRALQLLAASVVVLVAAALLEVANILLFR